MANNADMVRFTIDNSRFLDSNGQLDRGTLKDWEAQVKAFTKALQSATDGVLKVTSHIDDATGRATATFTTDLSKEANARKALLSTQAQIQGKYSYDPEFIDIKNLANYKGEVYRNLVMHKTLKGKQAQKTAMEIMSEFGGSAELDPTHSNKDRMKIIYPVSESEYQQRLSSYGGDEEKLNRYFARQASRRLSTASAQSKFEGEERDAKKREEERKKQERSNSAKSAKFMHWITAIIAILTSIADITRRILTASLARATEFKKESADAKAIGISMSSMRKFSSVERNMGMDEGAFLSAMKEIQSSLGDISNMNEKTIGELAKVLQGDTIRAIQNSLGQNNPEKTMELILNKYFERGMNGVNSIGLQVGQYQAQRELATALENAGLGELASILREMFYANDKGIYRGKISSTDAYNDFLNLTTMYTGGIGGAEANQLAELGQVVDQLKSRFEELKIYLEGSFMLALRGLVAKISNWDFGKSPQEKAKDIKKNIGSNEEVIEIMTQRRETAKSGIARNFELYNREARANRIDFSVLGAGKFSTPEEMLDYMIANPYYDFDSGKRTPEQQKQLNRLANYFRSPEGQETLTLMQYYSVVQGLIDKAQKNIDEGMKTGKPEFFAPDFTTSAIQLGVKKDAVPFAQLASNKLAGEATIFGRLLNIFRAGSSGSAITSSTGYDVYEAIKEIYFQGKDPTYEQLLASKNAKSLTNYLYDKVVGINHKYKDENKEKAVQKAIADKIISEQDVVNAFKANYGVMGWGISIDTMQKARELVIAKYQENMEAQAGAQIALSQAMSLPQMQQFMSSKLSGVKATVSGYDKTTGTVTVVIKAVDAQGRKVSETVKFNTDAVLGENKSFEFDLANTTGQAQERTTASY